MKQILFLFIFALYFLHHNGLSITLESDIPYIVEGHNLQQLDVYWSMSTKYQKSPVIFWIHGGGWVTGDKKDVDLKPKAFIDKGYVFVSINYRLLPNVKMEEIISDVAAAFAWTHKNISKYGGDSNQIVVGGHSAGAQLAALICIDSQYLKKENLSIDIIKGCFPSDGDTYDITKIIMTAEHRQAIYGRKQPTFGHRQKFGNDPVKHVNFSPVTHISNNKGIPPFLILYFTGNPDTVAQAMLLKNRLRQSGIEANAFGKAETNHRKLNRELGLSGDPATERLYEFFESLGLIWK